MPIFSDYKCKTCGAIDTDVHKSEGAPVCCDVEMRQILFAKPDVPRATFKLFRGYTVDNTRIESKEQEMRVKQSLCKAGESPDQIRFEKQSATQRRDEILDLRHEAINMFKNRSPQIAKRIEQRPMPEFKD